MKLSDLVPIPTQGARGESRARNVGKVIVKPKARKYRYEQLTLEGEHVRLWEALADISRETGHSPNNVTNACNGNRASHGGFRWKKIPR